MSIIIIALAAAVQPAITVTGHAWAPFISPMGEPFRARSDTDDTLGRWFFAADTSRDGMLTIGEMTADADRFFTTLDGDGSGEIDPDEIAHYEYEIAPDVQVMSRTRRSPGQAAIKTERRDDDSDRARRQRGRAEEASLGLRGALQGAARYGLLNLPQPVAAADTDFNRGVTREEFRQAAIARFHLLDTSRQGLLTVAQLQAVRTAILGNGRRSKSKSRHDDRIGNALPQGN
jgi:hypothetical protein